MRRTRNRYSPQLRVRADVQLRRITQAVALVSAAAASFIRVTLAREHPGSSAGANAPATTTTTNVPLSVAPAPPHDDAPTPSTPTTSSPTTTTTSPPTTTTTRPVVTSGGTARP